VDDGSSAQSEANTVALREIPGTKVPEMVETPTMTNTAIAEPVASVILPTPPSDTSPAPEIEVIIEPPISAHTLPQSETDGLTSGAVQPPGSTGEIDPTHKRDSVLVDGSDGTRATGNVDDPKGADVEDDEEGLIRRGGAGIPIGLVCIFIMF
jgi:RNA polymerase II subunit A small phosphatase-like protein